MPIKHAKATQKTAKKTSNARKTTANLYKLHGENNIRIQFFNIRKIA